MISETNVLKNCLIRYHVIRAISDESIAREAFEEYVARLVEKAKEKERKREEEKVVTYFLFLFLFLDFC